MMHVRDELIWLSALVVSLGALGAVNLGRGIAHLAIGETGPGVAIALVIGVTAAVLAVSALSRLLGVLLMVLRRRHSQ